MPGIVVHMTSARCHRLPSGRCLATSSRCKTADGPLSKRWRHDSGMTSGLSFHAYVKPTAAHRGRVIWDADETFTDIWQQIKKLAEEAGTVSDLTTDEPAGANGQYLSVGKPASGAAVRAEIVGQNWARDETAVVT